MSPMSSDIFPAASPPMRPASRRAPPRRGNAGSVHREVGDEQAEREERHRAAGHHPGGEPPRPARARPPVVLVVLVLLVLVDSGEVGTRLAGSIPGLLAVGLGLGHA